MESVGVFALDLEQAAQIVVGGSDDRLYIFSFAMNFNVLILNEIEGLEEQENSLFFHLVLAYCRINFLVYFPHDVHQLTGNIVGRIFQQFLLQSIEDSLKQLLLKLYAKQGLFLSFGSQVFDESENAQNFSGIIISHRINNDLYSIRPDSFPWQARAKFPRSAERHTLYAADITLSPKKFKNKDKMRLILTNEGFQIGQGFLNSILDLRNINLHRKQERTQKIHDGSCLFRSRQILVHQICSTLILDQLHRILPLSLQFHQDLFFQSQCTPHYFKPVALNTQIICQLRLGRPPLNPEFLCLRSETLWNQQFALMVWFLDAQDFNISVGHIVRDEFIQEAITVLFGEIVGFLTLDESSSYQK